jgi:AcrR family transcriptional regulator
MQTEPETPQNRTERKKEQTRQRIIRAAMEMFINSGFDTTTMEQIAETADIAKGTLYNYFPVKEAILDEYMKRRFQERSSEWNLRLRELPDTPARLRMLFNELLAGALSQRVIFEKYIIYRMQLLISFHRQPDSEKSGLYRVVREVLKLGQDCGELRRDLPDQMLEDLCEFAFIEAARQFYLEPESAQVSVVVEQCVDLFMHGAGLKK